MGSITHIVDEEKILNEYEYDAWGEVVKEQETVNNRFKFNGQQLDPITQQYYLRARFYNPVIARFTQEDTYRGDGLNLYAYCDNRPTYYVDPTGHFAEHDKNFLNKLKNLINNGEIKGNNIISKVDDNTQIIFRKDIGEKAHPIRPKGYLEPVDHYNIEIQTKKLNGDWGKKFSYHLIMDELGNIIDKF